MFIVGFSGGPQYSEINDEFAKLSPLYFHDAAAAIVKNGNPIFAIEEERLTRQKHTNRFPALAIRASIDAARCSIDEVEKFAFFFSETFFDVDLAKESAILGLKKREGVRDLLTKNISRALGAEINRQKIEFVPHHHAHAAATYFASGFPEALILVVDGNGESESLSIFSGVNGKINDVYSYPVSVSLGYFYRYATKLLGFSDFDEYKFMGLAPYGQAHKYFGLVSELYKFNVDGSYDLDITRLGDIAYNLGVLGQAEPPAPEWERKANFAAAIQQLLEVVIIDILSWWQSKLDLKHLCLAGGVAQNCVMNGVIAETKIFEKIFVHPSSHDAGAALGAAIYTASRQKSAIASFAVPYTPLLGPKLPQNDDIRREIEAWEGGMSIVECDDIFEAAADKIAQGKIIGWARGRSEFGPRALGNRSILGDPRPRENWQRINLAIKQRESFRPFAPAVLAEDFEAYFIPLPSNPNMDHMVFVARVREEKRAELGAVTHVNGTARVQVVAKSANSDFWRLISAFKKKTGCPVLLNTSFNNRYEPIVDDVADAIRTYLTTDLDCLCVGDNMAEKSVDIRSLIGTYSLKLSDAAWMEEITTVKHQRAVLKRAPSYSRELNSWQLARYLREFGGEFSLVAHLTDSVAARDRDKLMDEVFVLWRERFIDVRPERLAHLI
ncbi:carbamoyltransferase C-terminal domain-containing protein [Ensifer sp. LCM 4579]|uniref:carbamoyltransferase family protein n=1 Tax=Ensifer sp. LCM 4579 TaxID=1848292 RepID=UPI0008DA790F|nr:carbamoyltransferase C-terminal domain-containing protein [Ensifer sp. LCM 4579]OHV79339.1 hypothetical protein LCM4579_23540 [Ensifer sp. LCM 4579]